MERSDDTFHLIDLASQAEAVQALLAGRSKEEKIAWFKVHGKLLETTIHFCGDSPVYQFESTLGIQCAFFLKGESFVFIGDNTTWSVPRPPATPAVLPYATARRSATDVIAILARALSGLLLLMASGVVFYLTQSGAEIASVATLSINITMGALLAVGALMCARAAFMVWRGR